MATQPDDPRSVYRIFISFTSTDKLLAEYLADELRRILGNYDAVYCFSLPGTQDSQAGSRPADDFEKLIDDRLRKCNVFILLWSEAARKQNWINYELTHAKRLLIQKVRRGGKEFKIIPISINKCSIPFGISHLVRAAYASGGDPQVTLNQVLHALGLPAEHDDPHEIFLKKVLFEVRTAFDRKEWSVVVQKYFNLARSYPNVASAAMHYRYAIALLHLEQTQPSLMVVDEGLQLDNKEQDTTFLEQYIQCLEEKRLWNELLSVVQKAMAKFPGDARWRQLQWNVMNRTNNTSSFFLPPNFQTTQQPISVGVNGANGAAMSMANGQSAPSAPFQQFPSLFQSNFMQSTPSFSSAQQLSPQMPDLYPYQIPVAQDPHITRKLSEEELPSEIADSSGQKADTFTGKYLSYHQIKKLLGLSMAFRTILNVGYIAFISQFLSLKYQFIIFAFIAILITLCIGKFSDKELVKLACVVSLCIFWAISGFKCVYHLYSYLSGGTGDSLGLCIGIVFSIALVSLGGHFHLRFFHSEE